MVQGPSIKYVTLFLANFYPPPLSHFVTHPGTPQKVRHVTHLGPPPPRTKALWYKFCLNCSRGFCPGVLSEGHFMSGRFCPGWILSVPVLSEYICYIRKLNITLNFMFRMYDNFFYKCDVTCSFTPLPLSQTVTPSRTPSPLERDVLYGRPR